MLTAFLTPLALLSSWESVHKGVKAFSFFILALETAMLGVFVSLDLFLFYIFWDAMLIPMYFLIGIWGYERRVYAAVKFILYTMAGSVLMLVAIIALAVLHANLADRRAELQPARPLRAGDEPHLRDVGVPGLRRRVRHQGAAVPVPYLAARRPRRSADRRLGHPGRRAAEDGHLRPAAVRLPAVPERGRWTYAPLLATLAVIGIVYGALVAMVQPDMKKLVAYSSVSHLGFVVLGLCALNVQGVQGSVLQMLNHGVSTGGLFMMVGMLSDRRHTRLISEYGGLKAVTPSWCAVFLIITLASIALPLTNGFVGEFLILVGAFKWNPTFAALRGDRRHPVRGLHAVDVPARQLRADHERAQPLPARSDAAGMGDGHPDRRDGDLHGRLAERLPEADGTVRSKLVIEHVAPAGSPVVGANLSPATAGRGTGRRVSVP